MRRTKRKNIIKDTILEYVNKNAKIYIIVTIMLLIGVVLGIMFVNNTAEGQKKQISNYINSYIDNIKNDQKISNTDVLKSAILNDMLIVFILWFLGSTVIGMPIIYLIIIYKGYSIGYTISSIIATLGMGKGIIFVMTTMLLQYIIYIPCILSLAVSGIKLYKLIMEDRRRENIKIQIIRHTIFCLLILSIMILASLVESYISVNLTEFILHKM